MTSTNWGTIVDADSFRLHLEDRSGESGVLVEDFSLVGGRLRCNISNLSYLDVFNLNITSVVKCTVPNLDYLDLSNNLLETLTSVEELSSTITTLCNCSK